MEDVVTISMPGLNTDDVSTLSNAFIAKFPSLKIEEDMFGTAEYTFDSDILAGDERTLFEITHGYGRIPFNVTSFIFHDTVTGKDLSVALPIFISFGTGGSLYAWADDSKFYIKLINTNAFTVTHTDEIWKFKYYVFVDKGE